MTQQDIATDALRQIVDLSDQGHVWSTKHGKMLTTGAPLKQAKHIARTALKLLNDEVHYKNALAEWIDRKREFAMKCGNSDIALTTQGLVGEVEKLLNNQKETP